MKKAILSAAATVVVSFLSPVFAAPLTPGNLVMYRTGDGVNTVSTAAAPIFLDEYKQDGTLVQSIAVPTTTSGSNRRMVGTGNSTSEGQISLSANGQYVIFGGYDAAVGATDPSASTSATVNRVMGRMDLNGNFDSSTTITNAYSGGNLRSVTSNDGTSFYTSGNNSSGLQGIFSIPLGNTNGTQLVTNATRSVEIIGGQLYVSTTSGTNTRLSTVGSGLPVAATTLGAITGFPTTGGSPNQFVFLDLESSVAGFDTAYYSDDTGAGISKFSLVGSSWVKNGLSVDDGAGTADYVGLVALQDGSTVTLFATRQNGTSADQLLKIIDTNGYNANFSTLVPTVLNTAASSTTLIYHGLAFIPEPSTLSLAGLSGLLILRRKRK